MSLLLGKATRLMKKVSGQDTGESAQVVARKKQLDNMQGFYKKAQSAGKTHAEEKKKTAEKGAQFAAAFEEASKGEPNQGLANLFNSFVELESQIEFLKNSFAENLNKDFLPRFQNLEQSMADCTTKRKKYNDNFVLLENEQKKGEKASQDAVNNLKQQCDASEQSFEESTKQAIVRHETDVPAAMMSYVQAQKDYYAKASQLLLSFQMPTIEPSASSSSASSAYITDSIKFDDDDSSRQLANDNTVPASFSAFEEDMSNNNNNNNGDDFANNYEQVDQSDNNNSYSEDQTPQQTDEVKAFDAF